MKNVFKAIALCIGICAVFSGCGTGVTLIAMVSPSISQVSPQVVTAGTPALTVTVQGSNFSTNSALTVNGAAVPTSFVSATTLAAQIGASTLAQPNVAQLQVRNTNGSQSNQVSLTVASLPASPQALAIAAPSLPGAQIGVAYSGYFSATGGTPGYTWAVTSGSLPAGMTLTSAGVLSGTPTTTATSTFVLTVTDSSSPVQQKSVTLTIVVSPGAQAPATLVANSVTLGAGKVGSAYAVSLSATGGTPGYTWTVTSGSLPAGLALSSAGVISGTPTAAGSATFRASVSDSGSPVQTASVSESITVAGPGLSIGSGSLGAGKTGSSYSATLSATGGTPGYTWSVTSGSLPAGLRLSTAGVISGTPTTAGSATFTLSVSDSGSPVQTASVSESITVASSILSIGSGALGAGKTGSSYSATLTAAGGTPGYTWTVTSGNLPAGLTMSSSGVISGTPSAAGSATFTVSVKDSGSPVQTASVQESITVSTTPLSITSTALIGGTSGTTYSASLAATGGTPGYAWSIASGSLPAGLSLNAATGQITGTPTASGNAGFAVQVSDSENPVVSVTANLSIAIASQSTTGGTTWFVRPDGGNRYSVDNQNGQCDGQTDAAYPGSGVNQHCAFNDVRYMWMDGAYGNSQWVMAGGDTLVIRGCAALPSQVNPDAPHCRIGWDKPTGNDAENFWCAGVTASWGCSMPPPPNGTATQHTRILGACAYGTYSCNPVIGYPYTNNNLTQLFGGFGTSPVIGLGGSSYVDIEGLEITSHNDGCTRVGAPAYPAACNTSSPKNDYSEWGITTTNTTSNIMIQDVYIHGFTNIGMGGPIGGPITLTRVSIDFNAFAGWNFDDGYSTADAPGATITQSYVTMVGNGCLEEYPIVHTQFPAKACWDSNSSGFGDSWSGQGSNLASFTCDHCYIAYNAKDGGMGPHTVIHNLSLTNSMWVGNMGQAGKWGQDANATFLFQNNVIVGNCMRMSQQVPGATQNFALSTGLNGSYLSNFCRAAGPVFDYFAGAGSSVNFNNNTIVTYEPTIFEPGCYTPNSCGNTPYNFTNNLILGYLTSGSYYPNSNEAPGLYYKDDKTVQIVASHNLEYGIRNGDNCGTNGNICSDPFLVNEPVQGSIPPESTLDNLNFHPSPGSPAISAGVNYVGAPTTDFFGNPQTSPLTIGAVVQ